MTARTPTDDGSDPLPPGDTPGQQHPLAGNWQFEISGLMTAIQAQDSNLARQYVSGSQLVLDPDGNVLNEVRGFYPLTAIINITIDNQLKISGLLFNNRSASFAVPTAVTGSLNFPPVIDPITNGSMTLFVGGGAQQDYQINVVSADLIQLIMLRNTRIVGKTPFWMVLGGGRMRKVSLSA